MIVSPTAHAFEAMPLERFAIDFGKFGRRGLRVIGEEFQREFTRELMIEANRLHAQFPQTGRLWRSTRPFSGSPRLAGRGRGVPAFAGEKMVDRMKFTSGKPFGISNAASSPKGYVYAWQIWKGRGFRSGQMRGSKHLRRGVAEIAEGALRSAEQAGSRAIEAGKRRLRA